MEAEKREMGGDVAALDVAPVPEGRQRARFLAGEAAAACGCLLLLLLLLVLLLLPLRLLLFHMCRPGRLATSAARACRASAGQGGRRAVEEAARVAAAPSTAAEHGS